MRPVSRSLRAAVVALLAACGPAVAPSPPPVASAPIAAPESPPVASTVASSSASMRPFMAPWPVGNLASLFPQRAKLVGLSSLRLQRDVPVVFEDGYPSFTAPQEVIVTAIDDEMARVVMQAPNAPVVMMFWAPNAAFERVPTYPIRLALRPDAYPAGPAGSPWRDEVGVWLMPGWHGRTLSRREPWREVPIEQPPIRARGWLDERLLGLFYTPHSDRASASGHVRSGTHWVASPGGPSLAVVGENDGSREYSIEQLSPPAVPPGYVLLARSAGPVRVVGLVPSGFYESAYVGTGMDGTGRGWRTRRRRPPALTLAPDTDLLDGPGGSAVGHTLRSMDIPDVPGPPPVDGYRRVAFVFDEVGLVPVWVREDRVSPMPSPPAASASASASASSGPRR